MSSPRSPRDLRCVETLKLLALQRKLPASGGRRGARAVPILASGLWHQCLLNTEAQYLAFDAMKPQLLYMLGCVASIANVEPFALQVEKNGTNRVPNSSKQKPLVAYRNPVDLWIAATYLGGVDSAEALPPWAATCTFKCDSGEHCHQLLQALLQGFELELKGEVLSLTILSLVNRFNDKDAHPTHLRKMLVHVLMTTEKLGSVIATDCH